MIVAALVTETRIDLSTFMPSTKSVTGMNHVAASDMSPGVSRLATDLAILRDFAGRQLDVSLLAMSVGFLVAGAQHDLMEVIEYCGAMSYVRTTLSLRSEIECVLITGSLAAWRDAVAEGCKAHPMSTARAAFNQVYQQLCQKGLSELFSDKRPYEKPDGTFLLLESK